jgi:hypothetical protein
MVTRVSTVAAARSWRGISPALGPTRNARLLMRKLGRLLTLSTLLARFGDALACGH